MSSGSRAAEGQWDNARGRGKGEEVEGERERERGRGWREVRLGIVRDAPRD